jgi:hypothetical protein
MDATRSENAVTFMKDNENWEKGYNFIQSVIDKHKVRATQSVIQTIAPTASSMDELTKAGDLLQKGLITQEEFNKIKQKLLSK